MIAQVNQVLPLGDADVESLLSETEDHTPEALLAFPSSDYETKTTSSFDPDTDHSIHYLYLVLLLRPTFTVPLITLQLLPKKYAKPIPIRALFDTGAASSILHPEALPESYWQP